MVPHCRRANKLPTKSVSSLIVQADLLLPSAKAPSSPNSHKSWLGLFGKHRASGRELCVKRLWQKAAGNGHFPVERFTFLVAAQTPSDMHHC